LYVGCPTLDPDRRRVLTWRGPGTPEEHDGMVWEVHEFAGYVGIKSKRHQEWMYAGHSKLDGDRRLLLTWGKEGTPESDPDMRFCLQNFGNYVGILSLKHNEWAYANCPMLDPERRHALTWRAGGDAHPSFDESEQWEMRRLDVDQARVAPAPEPKVKEIRGELELLCDFQGGSEGSVEIRLEYKHGCKTRLTQESLATVSSFTKAAFDSLASSVPHDVRAAFSGALSIINDGSEELKLMIGMSKPLVLYQAQVTVVLDDDSLVSFRGKALVQRTAPIEQTSYRIAC